MTSKLFGTAFLARPVSGFTEQEPLSAHIRAWQQKEKPSMAICTLQGEQEQIAAAAVYRAANQLAAMGLVPSQLALSLTGPEDAAESTLRSILRHAKEAAEQAGLALSDLQCARGLGKGFVITAAVSGHEAYPVSRADAGLQDWYLVMTGYAGLEGTIAIYDRFREQLLSELPKHFCRRVSEAALQLNQLKSIRIGWSKGVAAMQTYGEGGVFRGLWDLGDRLRAGMQVDLPAISMLSQTIEACEKLDINPYLMKGGGSVLMVTQQPEALLEALWAEDIEAQQIGVLTKEPAKIIINAEEQRYIEPFRGDSLESAEKNV